MSLWNTVNRAKTTHKAATALRRTISKLMLGAECYNYPTAATDLLPIRTLALRKRTGSVLASLAARGDIRRWAEPLLAVGFWNTCNESVLQ